MRLVISTQQHKDAWLLLEDGVVSLFFKFKLQHRGKTQSSLTPRIICNKACVQRIIDYNYSKWSMINGILHGANSLLALSAAVDSPSHLESIS